LVDPFNFQELLDSLKSAGSATLLQVCRYSVGNEPSSSSSATAVPQLTREVNAGPSDAIMRHTDEIQAVSKDHVSKRKATVRDLLQSIKRQKKSHTDIRLFFNK
jgi:hypothetical protein